MEVKFSENVNAMFEQLERFFTSKTVVGEIIQIGEVSLIPIISISLGLGAGVGNAGQEKEAPKKGGSGGGMGAKATPIALVVVKGETIQVIPFKDKDGINMLLNKIPDLVARFMPKKEKEQAKSCNS